jgi:hypothetical protein
MSTPKFPLKGDDNGKHRSTTGTHYRHTHYPANPGPGGSHPLTKPPTFGHAGPPIFPDARPHPVRETGIRAGEITAWRVWEVLHLQEGPLLKSIVAGHRWRRRELTAHDDPIKYPSQTEWPIGIHAWKTESQARHYRELLSVTSRRRGPTLALGTVELWGSIVIHEYGYRAQYARILSLVDVEERGISSYRNPLLFELLKIYGLDHRQ